MNRREFMDEMNLKMAERQLPLGRLFLKQARVRRRLDVMENYEAVGVPVPIDLKQAVRRRELSIAREIKRKGG